MGSMTQVLSMAAAKTVAKGEQETKDRIYQ
jgi:hypothetical protein